MRPSEWLNNLLKRHNLSSPDSRPLYEYRVTNEEFELLKKIMELYAQAGLKNAQSAPLWDAAFVIYAAEWWRREYDGSGWAWDTIFSSFSSKVDELNAPQRNMIIKSGFRHWDRHVRIINDHFSYLGSVACEGGLPLKQLVKSKSSLGSVFNKAIPKYIRLKDSVASEIIVEYKGYLPKAYQNSDIYEILGDMIESVTSLKKQYELNEKTNPVVWLNSNVPTWRERFPLPMNDEISQTLLSEMVKTAATNEESKVPFHVNRYLNEDYSVSLKIEFQKFIDIETIGFKSPDTIPTRLEIELIDSEGRASNMGFALKTSHQGKLSLRMQCLTFGYSIKGEKAAKGYKIQFKHLAELIEIDEKQSFIAEELSNDVPWSFVLKNDEWILEGVASISTRSKQVRVLYDENLSCVAIDETTEVSKLATISNKKLIEIAGAIKLTDNQEITFSIKTAQETQTWTTYYLNGKFLKFDTSPKDVYLGFPELIGINKETGKRTITMANQLIARAVNSKNEWRPLSDAKNGIHEIRLLTKDRAIQFRKRCVLLNPDFAVRLKPINTLNGIIYLDNFGAVKVTCDSEINSVIAMDNGSAEIQLTAENTPPAFVSLVLNWPGMTELLTLKIPFPARGGQLIDAKDNILSREDSLFRDSLHGVRLRLFNESPNKERKLEIDFNLKNSDVDERDLYFREKILRKGAVIELAIIDYLEKITDLLALGKLDSFVKLSIYEAGTELLSVKIHRYQFSLERNEIEGSVFLIDSVNAKLSYDELSKINIMAMRLSQPEQEHIVLESEFSEQTEIGSWLFYPEKRVSEPWIIYPSKDSAIQLRPILWIGTSDETTTSQSPLEITTLHSAIMIADSNLRLLVIQKILLKMSVDFEHSGWNYLNNLWNKCSHLPLSSFDVWTVSIIRPEVLAAFCMKMDKYFIGRLTDELSVVWELISLNDWIEAFSYYRHYLNKLSDEKDINDLIKMRIDRVAGISESMMSMAHLLEHFFWGEQNVIREFAAAAAIAIGIISKAKEELDRRQANSQWPIFLSSELKKQWKCLDDIEQQILDLHELPEHHYSTVVLPVLLAVFCLKGSPSNLTNNVPFIFKLKQLKEFDETWFNEVFKFSLAYLSQLPDKFNSLNNESSTERLTGKIEVLNLKIIEHLNPIQIPMEAVSSRKILSLPSSKNKHQSE
jgi:hypothetical protein